MKKVFFIACFFFGIQQTMHSQVNFGIKGGINYNSNSIQEVSEDVFDGAKSKTGYHAGIWLRFKIPVIGLYLRPELVYTNLENTVQYDNGLVQKNTNFSFQKIDIPVLLGKKILGIGNVYIGPSFQYILDQNFSISDIPNVQGDGFTLGLQFGGGIELGRLGLDVRWERGFNNVESSFLDGATRVQFDTRVNQIIIGLSYRL
ncbi:PorT family protein [Polaribacter sp. BAL334]|uniref:porin family protein n=1 Tax=Polaribacter sp. BAL334 TaxID=1708178 RepID=UPI0018D221A5|nr:porin family protein [Polaribacter sp. BAL334]MBG7612320.1 PorT family protein [Polaribacter sp. BAL334]